MNPDAPIVERRHERPPVTLSLTLAQVHSSVRSRCTMCGEFLPADIEGAELSFVLRATRTLENLFDWVDHSPYELVAVACAACTRKLRVGGTV